MAFALLLWLLVLAGPGTHQHPPPPTEIVNNTTRTELGQTRGIFCQGELIIAAECCGGWLHLCLILAFCGREADSCNEERARLLWPVQGAGEVCSSSLRRVVGCLSSLVLSIRTRSSSGFSTEVTTKEKYTFARGRFKLITSHRSSEIFSSCSKDAVVSAAACVIIMHMKIISKLKIINSFIHSVMTHNCSCGFLFHSSDNTDYKQNQN